MGRPPYELTTEFTFEASHVLPRAPEGSRCRRLHGHSWRVEVRIEGDLDPERGWVLDFDAVAEAVRPVVASLDHHHLNEVEGLENPTSELVAAWIWERLAPVLPGLGEIVVHETCTARCAFRGPAGREEG